MPKRLTTVALIASAVYLFYIAATSQLMILHDAIGYEKLGLLLKQGGWHDYLIHGPGREPLYPFFIAQSMHLADLAGINYIPMTMILQIFLLLLSQWLIVLLLHKLNVSDGITAAVVLYAAFSPTLVNFTFILWSELLTLPLVLSLILWTAQAWQKPDRPVIKALLSALLSLLLVLVKAVFEMVIPLFLLPFFIRLMWAMKQRHKTLTMHLSIFLVIFLTVFYAGINAYKYANQICNGHYVIADRGPWALYGNIARRMQPLTGADMAAVVVVVPHKELCYALLDAAPCAKWGEDTLSNQYGLAKERELRQQDIATADGKLIKLSFQQMAANPLQAAVLGFLEGCKLFFWEAYTDTAYVSYPRWVDYLYAGKTLQLTLRWAINLLTIIGFIYALSYLWKKRQCVLQEKQDEDTGILLCAVSMIIAYALPYSFFFLFGRYAIPMAGLYLVGIGFWLEHICGRKNQSRR